MPAPNGRLEHELQRTAQEQEEEEAEHGRERDVRVRVRALLRYRVHREIRSNHANTRNDIENL